MTLRSHRNRLAVRLALLLAAAPAITLAATPSTQPTIQTVANKGTVSVGDTDATLGKQWLKVHFEPGQALTVYGVPLTGVQASDAIVGANSEYNFCLVLAGKVQREDCSAGTGHVIFWSQQPGARCKVMEYSGRDLQQSLQTAGRKDLADEIAGFTKTQDTRRWWGLVKPVNVNIGAPLKPSVDEARKSYLMQPEVMRIRKSASSTEDIARLTAWSMTADLKAQDTDQVAQLLSPEWFIEPAKRGELDQARHTVASSLVGQAWTKDINADSVRATDDPMRYWFSSGKRNFVMTLKPFDEMVYVLSIVPEESK